MYWRTRATVWAGRGYMVANKRELDPLSMLLG